MRGLPKNLTYDVLKVNVLASSGDSFHVDTLDLYAARPRAIFQKAAAAELGVDEEVVKKDLGKVLLKLEELQDAQIRAALEPESHLVELSESETAAALELLKQTEAGATTSTGPCASRSSRTARAWTVLPSPMSSARQAPTPSSLSRRNQR